MDVAAKPSIRLRRMTAAASVLTFFVITLGSYVRLEGAGLACPDWPGCFGKVVVPLTLEGLSSAQMAFPQIVLNPGKAWIEMLHRYAAGTLGLLIVGVFIYSWRERTAGSRFPLLPAALVVLVGGQALLGMLTVTAQLKPIVVTMHLIGGMTTLALLIWLILQQSRWSPVQLPPSGGVKALAAAGLLALLLQISLGGWTSANSAGLICSDFPTCQGEWVPPMDFAGGFDPQRAAPMEIRNDVELPALTAIHFAHRLGATIAALLLVGLFAAAFHYPGTRMLTALMLVLLLFQIALGISNVILGKPLAMAVLHSMFAATLLITVVAINFRFWMPPARTESFT